MGVVSDDMAVVADVTGSCVVGGSVETGLVGMAGVTSLNCCVGTPT